MSENPYDKYVADENPYAKYVDDAAPAFEDHDPSILPIKRVPAGQGNFGMSEHKLVVPGVIKDAYNTMISGGNAALGRGTDAEFNAAGREGAMMAAAPEVKPAVTAIPRVGADIAEAGVQAVKDAPRAIADATRLAPKEVPASAEKLKSMSQAAFDSSESAGVLVKPDAFKDFSDALPGKLKSTGYNAALHPQASAALGELAAKAETGEVLSIKDLHELRQVANAAVDESQTTGQAAKAFAVVRHIDKFMNDLGPSKLVQGNAPAAVSDLRNAMGLWSKKAKIDDIQRIVDVAERTGKPEFIQQQFQRIAKDDDWFNSFNEPEQKLIEKIAKTGSLDLVGKLSGGLLRATMSSGLGLLVGGPTGAVALPAVGIAAKMAGAARRSGAVKELQDTIALGRRPATIMERNAAARARTRAGLPPEPPLTAPDDF